MSSTSCSLATFGIAVGPLSTLEAAVRSVFRPLRYRASSAAAIVGAAVLRSAASWMVQRPVPFMPVFFSSKEVTLNHKFKLTISWRNSTRTCCGVPDNNFATTDRRSNMSALRHRYKQLRRAQALAADCLKTPPVLSRILSTTYPSSVRSSFFPKMTAVISIKKLCHTSRYAKHGNHQMVNQYMSSNAKQCTSLCWPRTEI